MHVVTIAGARPQFVKASALIRALKSAPGVRSTLVHTGQHYDANLSEVFFAELEIPRPDYHLGVGSATHGKQTARMLEGIEQLLLDLRPDWVLVLGDTNSTLAGALAAVKLHIPLAHVEAGLRSFNREMPEEINRVLVDHASDLLLAPTQPAVQNLRKEGISEGRIRLVGDVMYDVALHYAQAAEAKSHILKRLGLNRRQYLLATAHRAENTDNPQRLAAIVSGLSQLAQEMPVVFPMHPRTRAAIERNRLLDAVPAAMQLIEPVGYLDMVQLEKNARLVATDSGGVQKEAFFHGVPCATLRDETEWEELVASGWNCLVPPHTADDVVRGIRRALAMRGKAVAPYGNGDAAQRVVAALIRHDGPAATQAISSQPSCQLWATFTPVS